MSMVQQLPSDRVRRVRNRLGMGYDKTRNKMQNRLFDVSIERCHIGCGGNEQATDEWIVDTGCKAGYVGSLNVLASPFFDAGIETQAATGSRHLWHVKTGSYVLKTLSVLEEFGDNKEGKAAILAGLKKLGIAPQGDTLTHQEVIKVLRCVGTSVVWKLHLGGYYQKSRNIQADWDDAKTKLEMGAGADFCLPVPCLGTAATVEASLKGKLRKTHFKFHGEQKNVTQRFNMRVKTDEKQEGSDAQWELESTNLEDLHIVSTEFKDTLEVLIKYGLIELDDNGQVHSHVVLQQVSSRRFLKMIEGDTSQTQQHKKKKKSQLQFKEVLDETEATPFIYDKLRGNCFRLKKERAVISGDSPDVIREYLEFDDAGRSSMKSADIKPRTAYARKEDEHGMSYLVVKVKRRHWSFVCSCTQTCFGRFFCCRCFTDGSCKTCECLMGGLIDRQGEMRFRTHKGDLKLRWEGEFTGMEDRITVHDVSVLHALKTEELERKGGTTGAGT